MPLSVTEYKHYIAKARAAFDKEGEHIPLIFAYAESSLFVIPLHDLLRDSVPRNLSYAILRHLLQGLGVNSYVLISEAWRTIRCEAKPELGSPRVEILQIVGVYPDGSSTHTMMNIRNKKIIGPDQVFTSAEVVVDGGLMSLIAGNRASPEVEIQAAEIAARLRDQIMRN